ncbi:MAG: 50S ribosomal protein L23 [Chloroherpetonaceae bacterium]
MNNVLIRPLLTEKILKLQEEKNQYAFEVQDGATKEEVKKAVESKFGVQVISVRTMNKKGKAKTQMTRRGIRYGKRSDTKRAFVTLAKGNKIDYYASTTTSEKKE